MNHVGPEIDVEDGVGAQDDAVQSCLVNLQVLDLAISQLLL